MKLLPVGLFSVLIISSIQLATPYSARANVNYGNRVEPYGRHFIINGVVDDSRVFIVVKSGFPASYKKGYLDSILMKYGFKTDTRNKLHMSFSYSGNESLRRLFKCIGPVKNKPVIVKARLARVFDEETNKEKYPLGAIYVDYITSNNCPR